MSKKTLQISAEVQGNKAVIRIDGSISSWNNYAQQFKAKLDEIISQGVTDASVYINSPGGNCFEANEIANEIQRFKGTTTAHLGALCASAATYIACKCTKVIAAKNVSYMIHKPMTYFEGNADQVKADLKLLENLQASYAKTYSEKTGLTVQKIDSMWVQDYWMNADEAKTLGFIDEIEGEADITEEDVQAIKAYKGAPAITATAVPNTDTQNLDKQMKQLIITALALSATLSDTEVVAQVEALKAKAAKADALATELENLKKSTNEDKAESAVTADINAKKYTAAQKDFWKNQYLNDFEATKKVVESMPAAVKLSEQTTGTGTGTSEDRSAWTYADYQEKNPGALAELAKTDEAKYKELFKAHYGQSI